MMGVYHCRMPRKGDTTPLRDRFFAKVQKTQGCWMWTGSRFGSGNGEAYRYGSIMVSKPIGPKLAHRVSWELHRGPIPEGLKVLHACDVPCCVNPEHLFLGTQQDNAVDMAHKKRNFVLRGAESNFSKITGAAVRALRVRYAEGACPVKDLIKEAEKLGIKRSQYFNIVTGKSWQHLL